jgi:hypothetical protein
VTSLVRLCLEPEFTRGHGALHDALSAGRVGDEKLLCPPAQELPQAVDGPEALGVDRGARRDRPRPAGEGVAGVPAGDAAHVRDACARWARLRFAVDATAYPRPDAWCCWLRASCQSLFVLSGLSGCPSSEQSDQDQGVPAGADAGD